MGNQTFRYNYLHCSAEGDGVYFDNDHRDMHIYGNVIAWTARASAARLIFTRLARRTRFPQAIDCTNNIAINCHYGFEFVSALPSRIENNIAVNCAMPFTWQWVVG